VTPRPKRLPARNDDFQADGAGEFLLAFVETHEPAQAQLERTGHVQHVEPEDEATLLLGLLSSGIHDEVFVRSLAAAAELMRSI
jgi:hypothetical protein